jgi:hypothetical protein
MHVGQGLLNNTEYCRFQVRRQAPADLQRSQCKPLKPAPNTHFKRNFQPFCTLDVENRQKIERVAIVVVL